MPVGRRLVDQPHSQHRRHLDVVRHVELRRRRRQQRRHVDTEETRRRHVHRAPPDKEQKHQKLENKKKFTLKFTFQCATKTVQ